MPNPHLVTDGKTFKTDHGGCRPPTKEEADKIPPIPQHVLDKLAAKDAEREARKRDANDPPQDVKGTSQVDYFNSVHWDDNQGGTGCCTAGAANVATMAAGLFLQNIKIQHPSLGFGYYSNTYDATFKLGSSVSYAVFHRTTKGCCANALYSQDWLLTQFALWPGGAFNASQLPQPPAYEDGKTRRVLEWYRVASNNPDLSLVRSLLRAGHPIAFGMGNHAMCLIDVSADGYWFYAKDSLRANMDDGNGRGIRTFTADAITQAYDLTTVTLIEPGSLTVSTGNTQMLIDAIKADANGLVLGQITQTQVDKIRADVAMLEADAPSTAPAETIWFGTAIPAGATANPTPNAINEPWTWVTDPVYSQAKTHQSEVRAGIHQHYFSGATSAFALGANSKLFAYVYLDPINPPKQVLLMWFSLSDNTWNHQAYWGANNIPGAVYVGPLPAAGEWVRLEVPASTVGLENKSAVGMSFKLFDGRATWDRCGKLA